MEHVRKIIFLNGPPRSGKDTMARELMKRDQVNNWQGMKFAASLKVAAHVIHGLHYHGSDFFEERKDKPEPLLLGKTPRQTYIELSETMKEVWGFDFFGRVAASQIHRGGVGHDVIVTDCGFYHELLPSVVNDAGAIYPYAYLVRLHRDNTDFSKDSRSYLAGPEIDDLFGPRQLDFINDGDIISSGQRFTRAIQKLTYSEDPDATTIRAVTNWYESATFSASAEGQKSSQLPLPLP